MITFCSIAEEAPMSVKAIPEGYHSVTPYIIVDDAAAAIRFYEQAFGATEVLRLPMGDKIGHAEIKIGNSYLMLSDEWPDHGKLGPKARGGATSSVMVYLEDVDAAYQRAIAAGATAERPVEDQFYGDRSGSVVDPFGHSWMLSTHVEDVAPEEMERRMAEWSRSMESA
jgi:PhnB protein